MKKLIINKRYVLVDDEDLDYLSQFSWRLVGSKQYVQRVVRKPQKNGRNSKTYLMHREIMNVPQGMTVDHIDGDPLNNTKENLRICTKQENIRYRKPNKKLGTSRYKGVSWNKKHKKWRSHIHVNNEQIYLGAFVSEKEAALSYNMAAIKHHKRFALLNSIGETP